MPFQRTNRSVPVQSMLLAPFFWLVAALPLLAVGYVFNIPSFVGLYGSIFSLTFIGLFAFYFIGIPVSLNATRHLHPTYKRASKYAFIASSPFSLLPPLLMLAFGAFPSGILIISVAISLIGQVWSLTAVWIYQRLVRRVYQASGRETMPAYWLSALPISKLYSPRSTEQSGRNPKNE